MAGAECIASWGGGEGGDTAHFAYTHAAFVDFNG